MKTKLDISELVSTQGQQLRTFEEAERLKGGRPKKANNEMCSKTIKLHFTENDYLKLNNLAKKKKTTLGRFIKNYILDDLQSRDLI